MNMLGKTKLAMYISNDVFDSEILDLIAAGIADIKHCGPEFTVTPVTDADENVTDYVIENPLAARAVITYCRLHFGSPEDFDRLKVAYDEMKGQMRESSAFGMVEVTPHV